MHSSSKSITSIPLRIFSNLQTAGRMQPVFQSQSYQVYNLAWYSSVQFCKKLPHSAFLKFAWNHFSTRRQARGIVQFSKILMPASSGVQVEMIWKNFIPCSFIKYLVRPVFTDEEGFRNAFSVKRYISRHCHA